MQRGEALMHKAHRFTAVLCLAAVAATGGAFAQSGSKITTGDVLFVDVFRIPEMTQSYIVRDDGTISVPYIGAVGVKGLGEAQASENIAKALKSILRNPRVSVSRSNVGIVSTATGRTSEMQLEIIPLLNASAVNMGSVLQGMNSSGGSISFDEDTNSLLITDTPEAIKNMMNAVLQLDRMQSQMTQVRIEAKIAEVRVGAMKELGIRWFVQGDNLSGGFNPSPNRIVGLDSMSGNSGTLDNEFIGSSGTNGDTSTRIFPDGVDQLLNLPALVPLAGQTYLGFTGGAIDLGVLIDALVSDEEATLLANPAILTVNHKPAVLKMIDEFPYTEFGTEITGAQHFSVEFMELGIVLEVTPHVYQDEVGHYVKLELNPEISFPSGINNGVPIRSVRSSETVASVRDGQTLVVGGIITESEQEIVTKVPGIGDLPIIGSLFKHKEKAKERTELMIFVTPTVFTAPEDVSWDKMIDIAKELNAASAIPHEELRREARKD